MIKRSKTLVENGVSAELLKVCIAEHRKTVERFQKLDDLYIGKHSILGRTQISSDSPNNRIVTNFPKHITDTAIDTHDAELGERIILVSFRWLSFGITRKAWAILSM